MGMGWEETEREIHIGVGGKETLIGGLQYLPD